MCADAVQDGDALMLGGSAADAVWYCCFLRTRMKFFYKRWRSCPDAWSGASQTEQEEVEMIIIQRKYIFALGGRESVSSKLESYGNIFFILTANV